MLDHSNPKRKDKRGTFIPHWIRKTLFLQGAVLSLLGLLPGHAQQNIVLKNFRFAPGGYYPPPHQKQLRSLLTGASAEQQPGGVSLIKEGKFETFLENGQGETVVEAPLCFYEEKGDHSLHSPGTLRVQTADGKFSITGEGFRYVQTNSSLFISNRAHTIIHPELLQAQTPGSTARTNKTPNESKGMDIVSEAFDYVGETGVGNHRRNVHVSGPDLDMTAGNLQFLLPMKQRQLQRITAEENVVVRSGEVRATGERVNYAPDTGLIHISGEPKWQAVQREGQADELSIDRSNRIFRATGHAQMRLTGQGASASAFLPAGLSTATNSANVRNQVVEIQSSSYEIRTNSAEFLSGVQVVERADGQPRSKLSCRDMMLRFAGTNQMESMVAQHNVIMEQGLKRFAAENAVFTGTNQVLTLTGNPSWQDGPRSGQGDIIFLDGRQNELTARGNASLHLPAGNIAPAEFGAAKTPSAPNPTNQMAEISAAEYTLGTNSAFFRGGVSVTHPQMNLNCKTLNLEALPGDATAHTLVARDTVTFDISEKDQKIHGTGQKAVYTYGVTGGRTNDLLELSGKPMLSMANGSTFENDIIILDRANGVLRAPGKYRIREAGTPGSTNQLHLPSADLLKPAPKKKRKSST